MGKNRVLPRAAYNRGPTLGADGRMAGSWIRPRSTDPNILQVRSLDVWDASMGTLYGGTLYAGPNARGASPPRVIIGDAANGIQMYDNDGILCAAISWRNGSGRLGRLGTPGITWANGNMYIDGDAIITGSVRANRLMVGTLGSTFLEEDKLVIGTGWSSGLEETPSTFSGFLATQSGIGGFYLGAKVWSVDNETGLIITQDETYPDYAYATFGDGNIEISNIINTGSPYHIKFRSYSDESGILVADGHVGMYMYSNQLFIRTLTEGDDAVSLMLANYNNMPEAVLGRGVLWLGDGSVSGGGHSTSLFVDVTDGRIRWYGTLPLVVGPDSQNVVSFGNESVDLHGMVLNFRQAGQYAPLGWASRPPDPQEGGFRWDGVNHRLEYYDGSAWYYIEGVAA